MEVTFRATEIGSYEERGQLLCGASNFKDSSAEYHFVTVAMASRGAESDAKAPELRVELDSDTGRRYSVTSCLLSPSSWRLLLRESADAGEPISVRVLHSLEPNAYRQFVDRVGTLFAGRADVLQVGDGL